MRGSGALGGLQGCRDRVAGCVDAEADFDGQGTDDLDAEQLFRIMDGRKVSALVIGLPLNMDATEGPRVQSTRAFARNLERLTPLPIAFWDERLSTVAAERALLEGDTSRRRRAEVIDQVAAGYILQGVLDRLRYLA